MTGGRHGGVRVMLARRRWEAGRRGAWFAVVRVWWACGLGVPVVRFGLGGLLATPEICGGSEFGLARRSFRAGCGFAGRAGPLGASGSVAGVAWVRRVRSVREVRGKRFGGLAKVVGIDKGESCLSHRRDDMHCAWRCASRKRGPRRRCRFAKWPNTRNCP